MVQYSTVRRSFVRVPCSVGKLLYGGDVSGIVLVHHGEVVRRSVLSGTR